MAVGIGVVAGSGALLAWFVIIVMTENPLWWAGPIIMLIVWAIAIFRISRW